MNLRSIKIQLICFLALFAIYLAAIGKDALFLPAIFIAVGSAVITDSLLTYLKNKKKIVTGSSIISGLIVSYVLSAGSQWWLFSIASIFAVVSKHFIRIGSRHLFNPAAFGIFLAVILFGASTQWRGADAWYVFIPLGIYFVFKIRKIEIVIGYIAAFLILFGFQALIQKTSLLNVLACQNYYFIFVMLIEPKTTPADANGKLIFGIIAAALIFILSESHVRFDAELCGLLGANMLAPFLNKLPRKFAMA